MQDILACLAVMLTSSSASCQSEEVRVEPVQQDQRPIYVPASLPLNEGSNTVSVERGAGRYPGQVEFCVANPHGWDKEYRVENYAPLRVAQGSTSCTNVNANAYNFHFASAGFLGAMQHRGSTVVNLINLEGGRVTVSWTTN